MNNQITPIPSTLLKQKLAQLAARLQQQVGPDGKNPAFATLEQSVTEAFQMLSKFYKSLSEPSYNPILVHVDTPPLALDFNNNFLSLGDDIISIFAEFQNVQTFVLSEFNYLTTRMNRLQGKMKSVASLLGDYSLFSTNPTKDIIFSSDSFNNLDKIEFNSPLLNATQCEINQEEGIATLPIDRKAQVKINITDLPVINKNSNGTVGNNQESGAQFHGLISDILDGNPDTWFEYERVVSRDDGVALVLDLTINLGSPRVINFIRINPNNFGARIQVEVTSLTTSLDGKSEISVKQDIPVAGFTPHGEENVFVLAPSTSKFAGQGFFTFTPRLAKYVRISLRQSAPYAIVDKSGLPKYRYAIGLRDVEISALPYLSSGELVSAGFTLSDEVRKVSLLSNQLPDATEVSSLVSIDHFISPNDGQTWYQIRPYVSSGTSNTDQTVPELLDFNGVEKTSIPTESPVTSLRYKAVLKRNTDAFKLSPPELAQATADGGELFPMPTGGPYLFSLKETPIVNTIRVLDPSLGRKGDPSSKYPIARGTGGPMIVSLPFATIPTRPKKPTVLSDPLEYPHDFSVFVDGEMWTEVGTMFTGVNKEYRLSEYSRGPLSVVTITFGDDVNGAAVGAGQTVSLSLDTPQQLSFSQGSNHAAPLQFQTVNDTDRAVLISRTPSGELNYLPSSAWKFTDIQNGMFNAVELSDSYYKTYTMLGESIPAPFTYFNLSQLTPVQGTVVFSDKTVFIKEVPFIDGVSELQGNIETSIALGALSSGLNTISLPFPKASGTTPVFSRTDIFVSSVPTPTVAGDWNVTDRTLQVICATSIVDGGTTTYQFVDPNKDLAGTYSINYTTGEVYCKTPTSGGTVNFEYTLYDFIYDVARIVPSTDWTYDQKKNTVTLKDREILKNLQIPSTGTGAGAKYYEVAYRYVKSLRDGIIQIEPFFTPILKDYAMKIIVKGKLF